MKLRHYFPPLLACLAAAALAPAADPPPQLKLPEKLGPTVVKNFVKATATVDPNLKLLNIEEAWKKTRGEGVVVFVDDTGIDASHPEFKGVVVEKYNFTSDPDASDGNGHGTFCASEIVGQLNVDGVAPKVKKLVACKVLSNNGSGSLDWLAKAIRFAVKYDSGGAAKVISASLGASPASGSDPADQDRDLQAAIKEGIAAGIVFCFAAGNDDSKFPPNSVGLPARFGVLPGLDSLVVVCACDLARKITDFSSVGPATWVTVVGHDVMGALPGGKYGRWDGTSMATPQVAGLAALWLSANPTVPPADRQRQFADALRRASSFPANRHPARGYGLADAGKLLAAAPVVPPVPPAQPLPGKVTLSLADLTPESRTRLAAAGITELSLTLQMTWPYPAAPAPAQVVPVRQAPPPVRGHWVPPAPPWHPPPPQSVPQTMPPPLILPAYQPFGGRFRPRW